jgi:hypothetical protein
MYLFPFVFFAAILFSAMIKKRPDSFQSSIDTLRERELKANSTPAKDISHLDYITISLNALPFLLNPPEDIAECEKTIRTLSECPILNLTGITNTDLKLQYGVANLSRLAQYDENFASMQRTFSKWGTRLREHGYKKEAVTVLEYALSLGCDARSISNTLKELYAELPDVRQE